MKNLLGQEFEVGDLIFDYSPKYNCCQLGYIVKFTKTMIHAKFMYSRDKGRKIGVKYALKMSIDDVTKFIDNIEEEGWKREAVLILEEWNKL